MSRVYIACPLPLLDTAKKVAALLESAGHTVVSTWHRGEPTVEIEVAQSAPDHMDVADTCIRELWSAKVLVLLYGPETTRHGSIFETGVAYGRGCDVVACPVAPDAALPTILLWAGGVKHCDVSNVLEVLS